MALQLILWKWRLCGVRGGVANWHLMSEVIVVIMVWMEPTIYRWSRNCHQRRWHVACNLCGCTSHILPPSLLGSVVVAVYPWRAMRTWELLSGPPLWVLFYFWGNGLARCKVVVACNGSCVLMLILLKEWSCSRPFGWRGSVLIIRIRGSCLWSGAMLIGIGLLLVIKVFNWRGNSIMLISLSMNRHCLPFVHVSPGRLRGSPLVLIALTIVNRSSVVSVLLRGMLVFVGWVFTSCTLIVLLCVKSRSLGSAAVSSCTYLIRAWMAVKSLSDTS